VNPTRWTNLVGLALLTGALGWVLAASSYESLRLPSYAPLTAGLMAVFELGLARVVSRKVRGVGSGKQMHPLQIARAAVLAKASSAGGSLLVGFYGGYFAWVVHKTSELRSASHDAVVSGVSVGTCLLLVVVALFLERACRTPRD
jgi:hypothetical protein